MPAFKSPRYRNLDWFLIACLGVLVTYGVLFVGSARGVESPRMLRQLIWIAAGIVAFLLVIHVDYLWILKRAHIIYGVGLVSLVAVLFTRPVNNAHSWFDLGLFKIQPSEFMKLAWALGLAQYLSERSFEGRVRNFKDLWIPLAMTLVPAALVLTQPDLGTGMLLFPALLCVLFAAGASAPHFAAIGASALAGVGGMWLFLMRDYQKRRIWAWLDPSKYAATDAYQLNMAKVAIGSGGLSGKGLGEGTLNKLDYVPVKDTDLIFSVIAEEWGFLGGLFLLLVLALFIVSCLEIARRTREPGGKLLVIGVASLLGIQALVNLWVAVGLLPTTGVTFPFVSYGGSSMVSSFIGVGLIVNVGLRRHAPLGPGRL